jgi:hypothetical protein
MSNKRIFISADHGLAIVYFLQSDVVLTLLNAGVEVILLTHDALKEKIQAQFAKPGLTIEDLRLDKAKAYLQKEHNSIQWWLDFLRRAGASNRINLQAVDSYIHQVEAEAHTRRRVLFPLMQGVTGVLRRSRVARRYLMNAQERFTPDLYGDLFDRYRPDLVIASTPGWRYDRYLLREAAKRDIPTAAAIVGWDNTSSYSLPGAKVGHVTCWSEIQKQELLAGSDWEASRVNIAGIPSYDGYFRRIWVVPREEYFHLHNLDPQRKLVTHACSFVSFSPNIQNVEALARLVSSDALAKPSQLLIRLHPNHFMEVPRFAAEREQIRRLASQYPHVHVVEPVSLGGSLGYYSGEDMPEKSSMMAYSDVFTTVYSTMVVEASIHDVPVVSVCIDSPVGWPGKFTLPLSKIGGWPTHLRIFESNSGRVAYNESQLREMMNFYLENPQANSQERMAFIERECTYTNGSAGKRTAEYFLSLI